MSLICKMKKKILFHFLLKVYHKEVFMNLIYWQSYFKYKQVVALGMSFRENSEKKKQEHVWQSIWRSSLFLKIILTRVPVRIGWFGHLWDWYVPIITKGLLSTKEEKIWKGNRERRVKNAVGDLELKPVNSCGTYYH